MSSLLCPSCNRPLLQVRFRNGRLLVLWCGYGPCESDTANVGASGRTAKQAFVRLKRAIDEEQEKIPQSD